MFGRKQRTIERYFDLITRQAHDVEFFREGLLLIRNSHGTATVSELRDKAAWYLDRGKTRGLTASADQG